MKELIAKLEAATEGSRELEEAICEEALGLKVERYDITPDHPLADQLQGGLHFVKTPGGTKQGVPPYTTSLYAALTLVPEGWRGTHLWFGPNGSACNLGFDAERVEDRKFVEGRHQQFALAICIAALKARGIQ